MSPLIRRLAPSVLLLACALLLGVPPAQARENPTAGAGGWFEVLAHQVAQWAAGWLLPAHGAVAGQVGPLNRPSASPRPPASVDCGGPVDPNGRCLSAALPGR
jgi:hypothetical protein